MPVPVPSTANQPAVAPGDRNFPGLLDFIKRDRHMAVAALLGNAFHMKQDGQTVTVFFDRSKANLIPMLRTGNNLKILNDSASSYFGEAVDLNFAVGNDPGIKAEKERERRAERDVKANPIVKYIMTEFGGTMINCKILEQK